jgi:hypothetical protein
MWQPRPKTGAGNKGENINMMSIINLAHLGQGSQSLIQPMMRLLTSGYEFLTLTILTPSLDKALGSLSNYQGI